MRLVSMFKKTTKYGPILLGAWLIATGAKAALGGVIPVAGPILGLLAVAAGILILMDR
jgi:hypothetical protein